MSSSLSLLSRRQPLQQVWKKCYPSLSGQQQQKLVVVRAMSSYVLDGGGGGGSGGSPRWPVRKANTVFNIVPEGHKFVVERFGRLHTVQESGWFLAIPLIDSISYVIDLREKAIDIPPQSAITRDNVAVEVSGNLFIQFVDPEKAAYGAFNPLYSVIQVGEGSWNDKSQEISSLLLLSASLFP